MNYQDALSQNITRTKYFLKPLMKEDWFRTYESSGLPLNNLAWLIGHMAVSQNFLLAAALDMPKVSIGWAGDFGIGSSNAVAANSPSQEELLDMWERVNKQCLENMVNMKVEDLSKPNKYEMKLPYDDAIMTREECINHGLWHNAYHTGQIAILSKLYGHQGI